ncbi:hypothetical protein [Blastococcus montanus]|uniref:hypothetical protein n=1 Tax=Blastococcus montanus TaxID=3144973 RepID=UPI00320927E5
MTAAPTPLGPADRPWRTRAELLAARAPAVPQLDKQLLAPWRYLGTVALVAVTVVTGMFAALGFAEGERLSTALAVFFAGISVAAAVPSVLLAARTRAVHDRLRDWEEVEQRFRALPRARSRRSTGHRTTPGMTPTSSWWHATHCSTPTSMRMAPAACSGSARCPGSCSDRC